MQSNQPLFSNDVSGILKTILAFGAAAAAVITAFVKWGQSPFSRRLDKVEGDVNGVGAKIDVLTKDCVATSARLEEFKTQFNRKEGLIDAMSADVGELKSGQRALERADVNLMADIREMINAALHERDTRYEGLRKERDIKIEAMGKEIVEVTTRLEERENARKLMDEILDLYDRRARNGGTGD